MLPFNWRPMNFLGNIDPDIKLQLKGSETLWKNADICDIDNKMHLNDAEQP